MCHDCPLLGIVDWVYFKTQTLLATLRTQNLPLRESCVCSEVENLPPTVGCARSKTSVSHSSTESENHVFGCWIAHGWTACSRLLGHCDWSVTFDKHNTARHGKQAQGDLCGTGDHSINKNETKTPTETRKRGVEQLSNVDYVLTNTHSSQGESQLHIFEDNEDVIKMIIKGRRLTMRQVSRTHRVSLDWMFDRTNLEPKIQIKYVDINNQLADI